MNFISGRKGQQLQPNGNPVEVLRALSPGAIWRMITNMCGAIRVYYRNTIYFFL